MIIASIVLSVVLASFATCNVGVGRPKKLGPVDPKTQRTLAFKPGQALSLAPKSPAAYAHFEPEDAGDEEQPEVRCV